MIRQLRAAARRVALSALILAVATTWMAAAPVVLLTIDQLAVRAEVIVVGQVESVEKGGVEQVTTASGVLDGHVEVATVTVEHVLKGSERQASIRIRFVMPDLQIGYESAFPKQYAVFFLKASGSDYVPTNVFQPSLVAGHVATVSGETVVDRIVAVITAVLSTPQSDRASRERALIALKGSTSRSARAGLAIGLRDPDPRVQFRASCLLLEYGDAKVWPSVEAKLRHPGEMSPDDLTQLRASLQQGPKDEAAIPPLRRLIAAPEVETRRAAATALARTRSPQAIPALVQGLADSDQLVLYWSVSGLAEITGDLAKRTTLEKFASDKERYVAYWTQWARARGLIR